MSTTSPANRSKSFSVRSGVANANARLPQDATTALKPQKRNVGFVFQHYAAFKHMTVRDNVAFGLTIRKRPREEIRSRVEGEFKNERATILLSQKAQELSDRAKSEHDLKRAAKELGAAMKTSDFVLPDGQVPDIGSMTGQASVAFTLKPGEISGPVNAGNNGVVLTVLEKQEPTDQDFAAKKDQIRDGLLRSKQQGDLYIQVEVETPKSLTRKQRELLKEFENASNESTSPASTGFFARVKEFFEGQ